MAFYPKITAKQEDGDDGYCYVVRCDGVECFNGLTRNQLDYYKGQALLYWYGMRLRKEFPDLNGLDSERKAQELIKLNKQYNYKTPRVPIHNGCCKLAMAVESLTDCYCPIHGYTEGEPVRVKGKKQLAHSKKG